MKKYAPCLFFCIFLSLDRIVCEDCSDNEGEDDIKCPTEKDPPNFDRCCWNNATITCCPDPNSLYISPTFAMTLSLSVILSCIALAALLVLCCFWSKCPFFDVCRIKYSYDDIIAYVDEKEGEPLNMPPEMANNSTHYSPCHVTSKKVIDSV